MAEATKEDATSPTGSVDMKNMNRLHLKILRKDNEVPPPLVSKISMPQYMPASTPQEDQELLERYYISHLSEHLTIWEKQLPKTTVQPFYSFSDVNAMTENSSKRTFHYEMGGDTWSCEYFVKTWVSTAGNLMKTLAIHLPNGRFKYAKQYNTVDKIVGTIKKIDHKCFEDWVVLEKTIWNKLKPFETFMATWCGNDYNPQRVEKMVLYHKDAKQVDMCMRMDHITMEFSFKENLPVGSEDDLWD